MTAPIEGYCPIWPDDIEKLVQAKKASLFAFTPVGEETEAVEFPIYPPTAETNHSPHGLL